MKKAIFLVMILGSVMVLTGYVYAQEVATTAAAPAETAPAAGEGQEAYGEVVSLDANTGDIAITEYDYEKDEDVNRTYKIDKAATYENVKSLAEVKVGDWVALTLKPQKDGSSLATSVYVEKYDLGEEVAPVAPAAPPAPTVAPAPAPAAAPAAPAPAEEPPAEPEEPAAE